MFTGLEMPKTQNGNFNQSNRDIGNGNSNSGECNVNTTLTTRDTIIRA